MTLFIGRTMAVGIGVEATRGVGVAPTYWVNATSFSFRDVPERALSEAGFGGIWGGDQSPKTLERAEGEIEMELDDQSFGALLLAVFGTVSSSVTDTTAYTHTYTLQNDNQHDSLTITTIDNIGQLQFELGMIDTFEISVEPNAIVSTKVNFISKGSNDTSGNTASYSSTKKWLGRNLQFKVAATTAALTAAAKVNLKSLTLTIEKNAEANATLSTIQPEDIVNKKFNITGSFTLNYEDRTWLNYVKDGTYRAVRIDLVHTDLAGSSTAYYQFRLDLSKCSIEAFDPDFSFDDVVTQTYTFNALYDAGGNDNVVNSCYLINQVASY